MICSSHRSVSLVLNSLLAVSLAACAGSFSAPKSEAPARQEYAGARPAAGPPPADAPEAPAPSPAREEEHVGEVADSERTKESAPPVKRPPPPVRRPRAPRPRASGLKAGSADDNLQFGAFLKFLQQNGTLGLRHDVSDRVVVQVSDRKGLPLAGATVEVLVGDRSVLQRQTYADGRALVFRSEAAELRYPGARLRVRHGQQTRTLPLAAGHRLEVRLARDRAAVARVPLDVAFVFDTTGSMGDEIARLKQTIKDIKFQIVNLSPAPQVRFGMVLYRDRGDDYRTRVIPLTSDMQRFNQQLQAVRAGGGGDTPEDVQEGLRQAITGLTWRAGGVKLAFLIGDAPPHLDYGQKFTYVKAMQQAARRGIKIATVGASGLNRQGELVWRQLAQYTMAPFVFLTHGEKGDSEGSASSVSHHVGANWVAEKLDAIIVRLVKVELAHYSPGGGRRAEDYFTAKKSAGARPAEVLQELFAKSIQQLEDYAVERIAHNTPTVALPVQSKDRKLASHAGKLERRLVLGLARARPFRLLEQKQLPRLIATINAQLADRYDSNRAVQIGKLLPARLAVISRLSKGSGGDPEMLIKLVRLQTGEVLSVSLLKIDRRLLEG